MADLTMKQVKDICKVQEDCCGCPFKFLIECDSGVYAPKFWDILEMENALKTKQKNG